MPFEYTEKDLDADILEAMGITEGTPAKLPKLFAFLKSLGGTAPQATPLVPPEVQLPAQATPQVQQTPGRSKLGKLFPNLFGG